MKILYILPSYNLNGGTPKKTLDLLKELKENAVLFIYSKNSIEFKNQFIETGAHIYDGDHNNYFILIIKLLTIIKKHKIDIIQTQFTKGEIIGGILKILKPNIKLIIAFVGAFSPKKLTHKLLLNLIYTFLSDIFIFISKYVKEEKIKVFKILKHKNSEIIYNGTKYITKSSINNIYLKKHSILAISGLTKIKNLNIIIEALSFLKKHNSNNYHFYIAGEGPDKDSLEKNIIKYDLKKNIHLLGYQRDVGNLLNQCDVFVHPCYAEGFGIAVAEAMHAAKPIVVSNKGAMPELIENQKSGLVVQYNNPEKWANAISELINDREKANFYSKNAKNRAEELFSFEAYTNSYINLYHKILKD